MDFLSALKKQYLFYLEKGEIPSPFLLFCVLSDCVQDEPLAKREIRRYFDFDRKWNLTGALYKRGEYSARAIVEEHAEPTTVDNKHGLLFFNECISAFLACKGENEAKIVFDYVSERLRQEEEEKRKKKKSPRTSSLEHAQKMMEIAIKQMEEQMKQIEKELDGLSKELEEEMKDFFL